MEHEMNLELGRVADEIKPKGSMAGKRTYHL
jgi:hypothetical protein